MGVLGFCVSVCASRIGGSRPFSRRCSAGAVYVAFFYVVVLPSEVLLEGFYQSRDGIRIGFGGNREAECTRRLAGNGGYRTPGSGRGSAVCYGCHHALSAYIVYIASRSH